MNHGPIYGRHEDGRPREWPRCELREFEYCREQIWPSWAPGWVECGAVLRNGRCEKYGHQRVASPPTETASHG